MSVSPYRKKMIMRGRGIAILLFATIFLTIPVFAQRQGRQQDAEPPGPVYVPKKNEVPGPRAIAVLETTAHGMRLVPITIKVDGEFYDATVYMAQPVPMALDSGVIYEVFKSGEPVGDFTIQDPEQDQTTGAWRGLGSFVSKAQEDRAKAQRAKEAAAEAAQQAKEEQEDQGSRPVLKRAHPKDGGSSDSSESGSSQTGGSGSSGGSADDSDRPVLKKPESSTSNNTPPAQPAQPKPATTAGAPPTGSNSTATSSSRASNDADAPVLRRAPVRETVAGPYKQTDVAANKPSKQGAVAASKETGKIAPPPPGPTMMQVAISDAAPIQPHPYRWEWKDAEEQAKLKAQAEKLALAELAKFAAHTSGVKPGNLVDVSFDAFDLNYTNSAVVVLSARALPAQPTVSKASAKTHSTSRAASSKPAPSGLEFYVTVVGREDIYGEMQKEFAVASDNHHLDAYPKMKLIDAVDVDGNGAADLLFHSTSDTSGSFVIYRDKGWSLEEVISVQEQKG